MKSVLLCLLLSIPMVAFSQQSPVTPLDSSRKTFTIYLKDGGQYIGRIIERDAIKVVVRRQGGGLSYLAPSDITRIEPYQASVRTRGREQYAITMTDGTVYTGEIRERDSIRVVLRRRGGESILSPKEIARIERVSDIEAPVSTTSTGAAATTANQFPWLLYNQTAIPLKAGQLTYRNIWVLYNELSYGLFGFITLRASITPSFSGQTFYNSTLYTRPSVGGKLSIPLGNVHIGGDLSYRWSERSEFFYTRTNQRERVLTGFVTFGSAKNNLTLAYSDLKTVNSFDRRKSIDVGFMVPLGRRGSFVSDNRILIGQNSYDYSRFSQISGAFRINRQRHAFDLGFLVAIRDEDKLRFYPLPYLAFNTRLFKSN